MLEVAALVALTLAQPAAGAPPAASPAIRTQTPPAADPVAPTPPTAELLTLDGALAEAASKEPRSRAGARAVRASASRNEPGVVRLAPTGRPRPVAYSRYEKESVIPGLRFQSQFHHSTSPQIILRVHILSDSSPSSLP